MKTCLALARALTYQALPHFLQLLQVILNLLKNAIEQHAVHTTEQKWVRITLQPGILSEKHIIIEDNAGSIPAVVMKPLFDAYFSTKSLNGTGLGLYMSKMIIENSFNGQMSVENTESGRCAFCDDIP